MNYSVIPLSDDFSGTEEIIREYGANLEYNEFFSPEVYDNDAEIERLISFYTSTNRDRSGDTLHGAFSESERKIMESHALMTEEILKKVHFNSSFKNAGKWAAQHHECLNGKGYPYGLCADDLCLEVRILAVADICDALLATDRPYKKPIPREKAFEIMRSMAAEGKISSC